VPTNPNNCAMCDHKRHPPQGGWCYMFKNEPTYRCYDREAEMSDYGWLVLENIVVYVAALICLFLLPGWWKLMALVFLAFANIRSRSK
jgi:hypothetical protein